jgi:uncharacterized protein YbbC (DUF1343 family)
MGRETSACVFLAVLVALAVAGVSPIAARAGVDAAAPAPAPARTDADASSPLPSALTEGIDRLAAEAIARGKLPGCVVAVGRAGGIVYQKAFGARALVPDREAMTLDTIFDLASLTKPIATATALMVLADQGKIDLDEPVERYLPEFHGHGKDAISIRQILTHVSGLPSEIPVAAFEHGRTAVLKRIMALSPKAPPGAKSTYSDVGFLVLEEVIRRVTGTDLATFTDTAVFRPLGMNETGFLPSSNLRPRIAPTGKRSDAWIRGDVHDPRAYRLGGIAGHAGLFSTAKDLARYARMVLAAGTLDGARVLSTEAVRQMLAPNDVPGGIRALGWDIRSSYSANRGTALSRRAVGHGGYTGTSLWIDPEQDLFVIFLSNRVHPDGKGSINALAGAIATLVGSTLASPSTAPPAAGSSLALGIDVLAAENFACLRGLRFTLLTNDSARSRDGARTTDVLAGNRALALVSLLSPEHGLSAMRDERIEDGIDAKTKLPVCSLYGGALAPRTARPAGARPVTLPQGIDALVVDLPDVGTRFFTYASTLHAIMRAAAKRGLRVIVLDRPNPINGIDVAGPMLKASEMSAVNHHLLPIRHGMTMGELAEMMNADEHLGLPLEIVRMAGYNRRAYFDETGLTWWPPSPNLRTVAQAVLYPCVALLEATNVSVGRGTNMPFEVVGAPWIDGPAFAAELTKAGLAGVSFESIDFTPTESRYRRVACHGVRIHLENRSVFDPVQAGIAMALALRKLHRKDWDAARLHRMLGDPLVAQAILDLRSWPEIEALFKDDLDAFRVKRAKYLLYAP